MNNITLFKYAAVTVASALIGGALKSLVPALSQTGAKIEGHPIAFWCLLAGILFGLVAGALDLLDKGPSGKSGADHDL